VEKKMILVVVGTRPNFIKVTQFKDEAKNYPEIELKIVHTGQHFDNKMADIFFKQLNIYPDFFLEATNTSVVKQFADIMVKLEELIQSSFKPDLLLVVGDVNSTLAAALTANKTGVKMAHLESGLRSCDYTMPEENNRILTDAISDFFFITEKSGLVNLNKENLRGKKFLVGNTMIDTLVAFEHEIQASSILENLKIQPEDYALVTIHRPSNVDKRESLFKIIELLEFICERRKVVFPIHPRTVHKLREFEAFDRIESNKRIIITEPLDYFSFQKLIFDSKYVVTDSGGIQEESTFRRKPCLTLRPNTERPSTVEVGTNVLLEFNINAIGEKIQEIETGNYKKGDIPEFWDGKATQRIMEIIAKEI
jgi:UDP-N-acetylglucosamine 2-epimerase (non-hydrolysing)